MVIPPDGRQPADADDEARLGRREQARLDESVVTVARRGRGPAIAVALIVGAFLVGVVRPWDWLGSGAGAQAPDLHPGAADGATIEPAGAGSGGGEPVPGAGAPGAGAGAGPGGAYQAPTCAYPSSWRTASLQLWAGREARVWTAAEAVVATGPADPSIPFHPIASRQVEAVGWCAPVTGPDRPPAVAAGTLFRLLGGVATQVAVRRLEPAAASALGELWAPVPADDGRPARWPDGRYVIRLATPDGGFVRYLGLEVGVVDRVAAPSPGAASGRPDGSPAPGPASPALGPSSSAPGPASARP